jgi:hypothetical protein
MKPTISQAIAVVTTTLGLPAAARRRYRWHKRSWAFQAIGETGEVADLGDHRHRDDQGDPAHRLHGLDQGRHRPARQKFLDLALQPLEPHFGILDRVDAILQHDLLGGMIEADRVSQRRYALVQPSTPR